MSSIEIRYSTGKVEKRPLSKGGPVSVGRHQSNDICIDEESVAVMHCRISWNKDAYEVAAASPDGVEVNGTLVRHTPLRPGDLIRVGSADLTIEMGKQKPPLKKQLAPAGEGDEIGLKPIEGDQDDHSDLYETSEESSPNSKHQDRPGERRGGEKKRERAASTPDESSGTRVAEQDMDLENDIFEETDDDDVTEKLDSDDEDYGAYVGKHKPKQVETLIGRLTSRLKSRPARPGEQEVVRSPFVLGLVGGSFALFLAGLTIYLVIGRESSGRLYDAAIAAKNEGKFTEAIQRFEEYLKAYPKGEYTEAVRIELGKSKILKEIESSTANWKSGLEALDDFIRQNRERKNFPEQLDDVRKYARDIALGAALSAERSKQRELLAVSAEAANILFNRFPPEDSQVELEKQIQVATRIAEAAIIKQETFDAAIADIERAIEEKKPMDAFATRKRLLQQYPGFETNPKLATLRQNTLDTEQALVTRQEINRDAIKADRPAVTPKPLSLTRHTRSQTPEASEGRVVFSVAKHCCYGIDTITGETVWRRVIGLDTPFFPIPVSTLVPGLLMFDTKNRELILVDRRTGALSWRQPLKEMLSGPPLIHEGQIYLPTIDRHLYQINLASGRMSTRLKFSQKVLAPPVLDSSGKHLIIAGDQDVLYTVSLRPLECRSVSFIGHALGSIEAPLVRMGPLLLMLENHLMTSSLVRVLDTSEIGKQLPQVASASVMGTVRDIPTLRGRQLIVASSDQRITAFTVSDDKNQSPLSPPINHQVESPYDGQMFVTIGPGGQLWMASNALRRFEIKTNIIKLDPKQLAVGISTQPLQVIGQRMYLGRRSPYSGSVFFTQVEREEMTSHWRTVLGAKVLAWTVSNEDLAICVGENGEVFRITGDEIERGGFKQKTFAQLPLPDALADPLRATPLGTERIAVYSGGSEPRLWVVNASGQIERRIGLDAPLEAAPVLLKAGIVLPLPGRLKLIGLRPGGTRVEDLPAPVGKTQKARWSFLAALDDNQLVAIDSQGTLARIQFRTTPIPHLAQVAKIKLQQPVDFGFHVRQGKLFLADAGGLLQILRASTLEILFEYKLDAPASNSLWLVGNKLLVETERLTCFEVGSELKQLWSLPLKGSGLAGRPLRAGNLLVAAKKNGTILALDSQNGTIRNQIDLWQPLNSGPQRIAGVIIVPSHDGSLHRVESVLKTGE